MIFIGDLESQFAKQELKAFTEQALNSSRQESELTEM